MVKKKDLFELLGSLFSMIFRPGHIVIALKSTLKTPLKSNHLFGGINAIFLYGTKGRKYSCLKCSSWNKPVFFMLQKLLKIKVASCLFRLKPCLGQGAKKKIPQLVGSSKGAPPLSSSLWSPASAVTLALRIEQRRRKAGSPPGCHMWTAPITLK